MTALWFIVPVHGRHDLTEICLRQLRLTCDALCDEGLDASAVVIADRANLRSLRKRLGTGLLGFGHIERDNAFLSRRFNDGIQLACDPVHNPHPVDFVVPCGSDDWVDHRLFLDLQNERTVRGFQRMSFVAEDGSTMTSHFLNYPGGCGIRIYPRQVMEGSGYRPADEDRTRACDTSILTNLRRRHDWLQIEHMQIDPRQFVDWKSPNEQLNSYDEVHARYQGKQAADPFEALIGIFPQESLTRMQLHYQSTRELILA